MGLAETRKYRVFKRELGLLITGFALFLVLNGCGSAGVAPSSTSGGETTTSTADTTLIVPVDSSVSASVSKSVVRSVVKSVPKSVSKSSSPSFSVGKGVSASASSNDSSNNGESVEEEVVVVVAKAASDGSSDECDAYDGKTGNQVNTAKAKIEGGQAKLPIDSSKLSSADTIIKLVCKVNGTSLPILLPNDIAQSLLSAKGSSVESKIPLGATAIQAFYQMAVGMGNVGAMSENKLPANILALNPQMFFNDVAKINADSSQILSTAYQANQKAIFGFIGSRGVGGFTDFGKFCQDVSGGNTAIFAQAAGISAAQASTYVELEKKSAQFTGPMLADPKINALYLADPAYVTQMNSFRYTNFANETVANKMAVAMMQAPAVTMTMFQDHSNFKTMNMSAAGQVLTQAVDNNIIQTGSANAAQFEALRTTAYQTNFSGKTVEQIQNTMSATTNYIRTNEFSTVSAATLTAVTTAAEFFAKEAVAGTLDATKLDSAFMSAMQTNIQSQVVTQVQTQTQTFEQSYTQATSYVTTFTSTFSFTSFVGGGTPAISDRYPYVGADALLSVSALSGGSPTTPMYIKFSMPMDVATLTPTNITLTCNGVPINRTIAYDSTINKITIKPMTVNGGIVPVLLPKNQTCIVGLGAGIKSQAAVALSANNLSFTTERDAFSAGFSAPASGATNQSTNINFSGTANYPIDSASISNITLSCGGSNIAGTVTLSNGGLNWEFDPTENLPPSSNCTITLGANLRDIYGADRTLGVAAQRSITAGLGSDITAPIWALGATSSWVNSSSSVGVSWSWNAWATDDVTAVTDMTYKAWCATTSGGQNFANAATVTRNPDGFNPTSVTVNGLSANTTYYCVVRPFDQTGNFNANLQEVSVATKPLAPSGLGATAGNQEVALAWTPVAGVTNQKIYWYTSSGVGTWNNLAATLAGSASSYTHTGRTNGTIYYYVVTSIGIGGGESAVSNEVSATPVLPPPPVPTGLSAVSAGAAQINLTWNASSGASNYEIHRSTSSGSGFSLITTVGAVTSYSNTGLSSNTAYYYKIKSSNGSLSAFTSEVTATTDAIIVTKIVSGYGKSVALKSDGSVWAWGGTRDGDNDISVTRLVPRRVHNGLDNSASYSASAEGKICNGESPYTLNASYCLASVVDVSAGAGHFLAVKSDGTVWSWGSNHTGQLGDNSTTTRNAPVQVKGVGNVGNLTGITKVSAGFYHSLAMGSDGSVYAWGANAEGQLGDNTTTYSLLPIQVHGVSNSGNLGSISAISAGTYYSMALKSDGTKIYAWGDNLSNQMGNATGPTDQKVPVEVTLPASSVFTAIYGSNTQGFALRNNGVAYGWGENSNGQVGDNSTTDRTTPVSVNIDLTGSKTVLAIATSSDGGVVLRSDNTVWGWGLNTNNGIVGDNTTTQRSNPVQVCSSTATATDGTCGSSFLTSVNSLFGGGGGGNHIFAIKSDGTVWSWGKNNNGGGELGDNSSTSRTIPVKVINADATDFK